MYTADGTILTSVALGAFCDAGSLCAETGAILEAHKMGRRVAAIACVSRQPADSPILVLTPCGICQERLVHFGLGVQVAVPLPDDPTRWQMKTLEEVQPYHWSKVFGAARPQ